MGQNCCHNSTQKYQFSEEFIPNQQHTRKAHNKIYAIHKDMQECSIPKCKCNLLHPYDQKNICELCVKHPPPFINNSYGLKYIKADVTLSDPLPQKLNIIKSFKHQVAQKIPTSIGYFNAWSLPTSRYYIHEDNPAFKYQDLSKRQQDQPQKKPQKAYPAVLLNNVMNQRVQQPVLIDPVNQNKKNANLIQSQMGEGDYRRKNQNLNIY